MKDEIIYTDDYALIVSDEHIKDVRPFMGQYHLEGGLTINKFPNYLTDLGACKLIIAHRPLTNARRNNIHRTLRTYCKWWTY